jgi:hypothetical protein
MEGSSQGMDTGGYEVPIGISKSRGVRFIIDIFTEEGRTNGCA